MFKNTNPEANFKRYYYQIPINAIFLALSIIITLAVQRYEQSIGGGIGRPLLFLLINLEIFIAIFLAASIIRQSIILFLERRKDRPGSIFKQNLLFSFIFLSILPGIFIFLGASKLVVKHLDLWFGSRMEKGISSGLILYEEMSQPIRYQLQLDGNAFSQDSPSSVHTYKGRFEAQWWPFHDGIIQFGTESHRWRQFREFNDREIQDLKEDLTLQLEKLLEQKPVIIDFFGSTYWIKRYPKGFFTLIYRPEPLVRSALIRVQNANTDYQEVRTLRHSLKFNFYLQAILLLFLVLVLAIWCAFYLARGISTPIQNLLEATNKVRAGKLVTQLTPSGSRDLQALTISFNEMTKSLAAAQESLVKVHTMKTWQEAAKQIAHEIKNPLTPIQLITQQLQRKCTPLLPEASAIAFHEGCSVILKQVETIKTLIASFASFATPTNLELKSHNIVTIITEVIRLFQLSYPEINFSIITCESNPTIMIDEEKIKRVFTNIITNSIEAFKTNNPATPTITFFLRLKNDILEIIIEDNGPGIAQEIADKLFLPYISTNKKNMGFGLAIVQEIITQHHGSITSEPAKTGASFKITVPCYST